MRHIISILLENESGALSRVAGLFSARGYNIQSLTVAPTEDPSLSRITLVTSGTDDIVEQIKIRILVVVHEFVDHAVRHFFQLRIGLIREEACRKP